MVGLLPTDVTLNVYPDLVPAASTLSNKHEFVELAAPAPVQSTLPGPSNESDEAYPTVLYVALYAICAVLMDRTELTADASFAAMRERKRFGIAIAAMIKMIAITTRSSISEKPFCLLKRGPP